MHQSGSFSQALIVFFLSHLSICPCQRSNIFQVQTINRLVSFKIVFFLMIRYELMPFPPRYWRLALTNSFQISSNNSTALSDTDKCEFTVFFFYTRSMLKLFGHKVENRLWFNFHTAEDIWNEEANQGTN